MQCVARKLHTWHGEVWWIDPDWRTRLAEAGITQQTAWTEFVGDELVSFSQNVTQCHRSDLPSGGSIYVKRYVYPRRFWHEFWLRPAKSAVECWAYTRLRALGIPTLDVLALGERRRFGMLLAACIVTRGIPNTIDLVAFAKTVWCRWPRPRRRQAAFAIAERLLDQARTAHVAGFFHHDLKWRNLLIDPDGNPDTLVWIDAPRASTMPGRRRRGVIADLSGLARIAISLFSRTDRMRFLRLYLGPEDGPVARRELFRDVDRHLARRMPRALVLDYLD
jgi:hypothetical protein